MTDNREALIAKASWWSGFCTDNDGTIPELAQLGGFLLEVKEMLAEDRVIEAWTNPGPAPYIHYRAQERLRDEWPALAQALDRLTQFRA